MLALQRELARDPDLIPAPSSGGAGVIGPLLIRLCSVTALAALVAWGHILFRGEEDRGGTEETSHFRRVSAL